MDEVAKDHPNPGPFSRDAETRKTSSFQIPKSNCFLDGLNAEVEFRLQVSTHLERVLASTDPKVLSNLVDDTITLIVPQMLSTPFTAGSSMSWDKLYPASK
ncbi:MAG: hypothetical protein V3W41_17575 [Planctomycetota bacterium]